MKFLIILLIFPFISIAQSKDTSVHTIDTSTAILHITNSKLKSLQHVGGYVIKKDGKVTGFLTRRKKPFPPKVQVWGWN